MKQIFLFIAALLMAACSNDTDYSILSEPISASTKVMGGVTIEAIADFAPNAHAASIATYRNTSHDITINGWSGLSAEATFTNTGYRPIELDAGRIFCITSCHNQAVACDAIYDAEFTKVVSRHITVAPRSSITVIITFADVFKNASDGDDIELTFWAVDAQNAPSIGFQSYGGDKTIIYTK